MKKLIILGWVATIGILSLLSYTQVDLNLTLLNWKPYLDFQTNLTQLGYFNRPLNGILFTLLFTALIGGYLALVKSAHAGWVSLSELKKLALVTSMVLLFSYSVFSHDIFNYIFDARIVTLYQQNPYQHKALDYPSDEWIRFMQWTHRTYPYGPSWLAITIIPSILGFAKLLPTYLLFKSLFAISYLVMLHYFIRIMEWKKTKHSVVVVAYALLAFNPLVLIDGLVSSRIDIVMAATAFIGIYYHLKKSPLSYLWLFISAGTKFATLGFLPVFFLGFNKLKEARFFLALLLIAFISVPAQALLRELQPWYLMLPSVLLPFMYPHWRLKKIIIIALLMLLPMSAYLYLIYTGISLGALWFL
ncbi:MAG: hypothetical protein M3Q44_03865 [bacterium]|nr:hypothetical protein [bacterium]